MSAACSFFLLIVNRPLLDHVRGKQSSSPSPPPVSSSVRGGLVGRAGLRQCMGFGIVSKAVPDRLGLAVITSAFNSCWCDCVLYLWSVHLCAVYCMYRSVCVSGGTQHYLWLCTQSAKCILLSVHSCRPLDCM